MKRKRAGNYCYYEAEHSADNSVWCHVFREESTVGGVVGAKNRLLKY
jgi:hypothetical protein